MTVNEALFDSFIVALNVVHYFKVNHFFITSCELFWTLPVLFGQEKIQSLKVLELRFTLLHLCSNHTSENFQSLSYHMTILKYSLQLLDVSTECYIIVILILPCGNTVNNKAHLLCLQIKPWTNLFEFRRLWTTFINGGIFRHSLYLYLINKTFWPHFGLSVLLNFAHGWEVNNRKVY